MLIWIPIIVLIIANMIACGTITYNHKQVRGLSDFDKNALMNFLIIVLLGNLVGLLAVLIASIVVYTRGESQ